MRLKQLTYLLLFTSLILFSFSCKKKELPDTPYENSPIFNIVGTINDVPFELHAGENDAFMISKTEYLNGVKQFSGDLNDGKSSMLINIFNTNLDIPNLVGNFVEKQNYSIAEQYGIAKLLEISKQNFSNNGEIDYIVWSIDGVEQNNSTLSIYEPGKYALCAELHYYTGEKASACNTIIVGYQNNANYTLDYSIQQNENINAFIEAPNNTILNVKWYINDEFQTDSLFLSKDNIPDKFSLKAKVQFQNGVISEREIFVNKNNEYMGIEDFSNIGQKSTLTWDTSVKFIVKSEGQVYQSINDLGINSIFKVTDISEFETNSNGSPVKLIKGTLDSPFYDTATGAIVNGTFNIEIGVGY